MNWKQIIKENKPLKYKRNHFEVSLRDDPVENWDGNDFSPKDLSLYYEGQRWLYLHIYKRDKDGEQLWDTIRIDLRNYNKIAY